MKKNFDEIFGEFAGHTYSNGEDDCFHISIVPQVVDEFERNGFWILGFDVFEIKLGRMRDLNHSCIWVDDELKKRDSIEKVKVTADLTREFLLKNPQAEDVYMSFVVELA